MPTPLPITGRPIRLAVIGLGQVSELVLPSYTARDDIAVVGLCDLDPARHARWATVFPDARATADIGELLDTQPDVVDVLVPTPAHGEVVTRVLDAGFHVQVQKPIARLRDINGRCCRDGRWCTGTCCAIRASNQSIETWIGRFAAGGAPRDVRRGNHERSSGNVKGPRDLRRTGHLARLKHREPMEQIQSG